jgi:predicted nucleic acid-binding protein
MAKAIKVVVDTNIIFSALLNSNSKIGEVLLNSEGVFEFFSCEYMRFELDQHWNKLKKIAALTEEDLNTSKYYLFKRINFINEALIAEKHWLKAESLVSNIDEDDIDLVALNEHLKGLLWTGDKQLINGLKKLNYKKVMSTSNMVELRENKL